MSEVWFASFDVSRQSLSRWQTQLEQEGTLSRRSSELVGRPRAISEPLLQDIEQIMKESPSAYLSEIADFFSIVHGEDIATSTICRTLKDLGQDRKVLERHAAQHDP